MILPNMSLVTVIAMFFSLNIIRVVLGSKREKNFSSKFYYYRAAGSGSKTGSIAAIMGGNCFGAPKLSLYCSVIC